MIILGVRFFHIIDHIFVPHFFFLLINTLDVPVSGQGERALKVYSRRNKTAK